MDSKKRLALYSVLGAGSMNSRIDDELSAHNISPTAHMDIRNLVNGKANASHTHAIVDIDSLQSTLDEFKGDVDAKVTELDAQVASISEIAQGLDNAVSGLDTKVTTVDTKVSDIDSKVTTVDTNLQSSIDGVNTDLSTKIDTVTTELATKANISHTHAIADIQGLNDRLVSLETVQRAKLSSYEKSLDMLVNASFNNITLDLGNISNKTDSVSSTYQGGAVGAPVGGDLFSGKLAVQPVTINNPPDKWVSLYPSYPLKIGAWYFFKDGWEWESLDGIVFSPVVYNPSPSNNDKRWNKDNAGWTASVNYNYCKITFSMEEIEEPSEEQSAELSKTKTKTKQTKNNKANKEIE